jgi:hypothetical protein
VRGDEDETDDAPRARAPIERQAEPLSTRRALAKGYSLKDIKNARERLKRHALAVAEAEKQKKAKK